MGINLTDLLLSIVNTIMAFVKTFISSGMLA